MNYKNKLVKLIAVNSFLFLVTILVVSHTAMAQKQEIGVMIGYDFTQGRDLSSVFPAAVDVSNEKSFQFLYGRRMADAKLASFHGEFLVTLVQDAELRSPNPLSPRSYSSAFITPGVKLKLLPGFILTPYVAGGAGLARFNQSATLINGTANSGDRGSYRFVMNYGGGLEFNAFPFLSFRAEVRDFVAGNPNLIFPITDSGNQHNVIPAVGIVLRF
jgi:opacity protein-like surface antigen